MPSPHTSNKEDYSDIGRALFGNAAELIIARIDDYSAYLPQAELTLIENAITKRVHEFSTGRYCAHQALQKIGADASIPLLKGEYREPLWPPQIVGSISHCRDLAAAVVANKASIQSLGLDVENRKTLDPRIERHICTADETAWLGKQPIKRQNLAMLLIFSIKESIFKCIYQASGIALRFQQCSVVPDFNDENAEVNINAEVDAIKKAHCLVRFRYTNNHVYSGASLFATTTPNKP